MKEYILKFLKWVLSSFDNHTSGMSGRKASSFHVMLIYTASRIIFMMRVIDPYYLLLGSIVDGLFILLLFGIVTLEQISKLRSGGTITTTDSTSTTNSQTTTDTTVKDVVKPPVN
jgi:hypothetical protein